MTSPKHPLASSPAGDTPDATADDLLVGELTAALVDTRRSADDALPPALAERITLTGEALVRASRTGALPAPAATPRARRPLLWTGWLAAAALLGIMVVRGRGTNAPANAAGAAPATALPASALDGDVRLLRATLLTDPKLLTIPWTPAPDTTGRFVEGGVEWSPAMQRGVMRITGLMPNDTTQWQYQLWIFDKTRDEKYPVDGGVFNIAPGQVDVLVPFRGRIPVGDAVMFAVTVEKPGGVVVSTRERIAMLAKL
jgi:hypothetical protein